MVRVNAPLCTLGEGPLWHRETGEFVFTDIVKGTLYAWNPQTQVCRTLLTCEYQLGAFLFDTCVDLILFTECGVFSCPYEGRRQEFSLLFSVDMTPGERFNDAICDPCGRMIAGTKTERDENGSLYLFARDEQPRLLMKGLQISNGMGFSADGTIFYHTDSGRRAIYRYRYDADSGAIFHPSGSVAGDASCGGPFGEIVWKDEDKDQAVPDGMTVDSEGNLWTAFWGRGCVACIDPLKQTQISVFRLPAAQVSSVSFGGEGMDLLLVTSAAVGTAGAPDGEVYCLHMPVAGREEYRYQV